MDSLKRKARWGYGAGFIFILLFQWWSRYAGAPLVDFVVDDWRLWKIGQSCHSLGAALGQGLNWPDRPIGTAVMIATYYLLGDYLPGYLLLESVYTALFLAAGMWMVFALTGDRAVVLIFGLVFSLLPNLTESFQWHTMTVSYGLGFTAYLVAAAAWVHWLKSDRWPWLLLSVASFAFALGSYEAGILLPGVFLLLAHQSARSRLWAGGGLMGVVVLFYLAWKFTEGFGTLNEWLFPHRGFNPDWAGILWNAKELVRWWLGSRMLECISNGLDGFLTLSATRLRLLAVVDALLIGIALWAVRRSLLCPPALPPGGFSRMRVAWMGAAWLVAANVLTLLSWNAGRMNYLPAVGAALLMALAVRRWWRPAIPAGVALIMMLCLMANQGTSAQWRDSGIFHRAMYEHLARSASEWKAMPVVFFDTAGIRNRLTRSLLAPPLQESNWGLYGNVLLMRGGFMAAMMDMAAPEHKVEHILMDIEYGARISGTELVWQGWYNSAEYHAAPLSRVYRIDCQQVAMQAGTMDLE